MTSLISRLASVVTILTIAAQVNPAEAGLLTNSGFDGPEVLQIGDNTQNPITTDPSDTWLIGGDDGGSDSDLWDIVGGVADNGNGSEAQGMIQWIQDNQASTGEATLDFDLLMDSGTGDYDLAVYVFGWNAGDDAPGSDYENATLETADSFVPDDSVSLITEAGTDSEGRLYIANNGSPVFPGAVDDGVFHSISVDLDLGSGFDFVGVQFYAENGDGTLQIDNADINLAVSIPEPTTLLLTLAGLGGLVALPRRNRIR